MAGRPTDLATFDAFRGALQVPHRRAIAAAIQEDLVTLECAVA